MGANLETEGCSRRNDGAGDVGGHESIQWNDRTPKHVAMTRMTGKSHLDSIPPSQTSKGRWNNTDGILLPQ